MITYMWNKKKKKQFMHREQTDCQRIVEGQDGSRERVLHLEVAKTVNLQSHCQKKKKICNYMCSDGG